MPDNRNGAVQSTADIYAGQTMYNQLSYMMRTLVNREINTAIPVKVPKVMPGNGSVGYVAAVPLYDDPDHRDHPSGAPARCADQLSLGSGAGQLASDYENP